MDCICSGSQCANDSESGNLCRHKDCSSSVPTLTSPNVTVGLAHSYQVYRSASNSLSLAVSLTDRLYELFLSSPLEAVLEYIGNTLNYLPIQPDNRMTESGGVLCDTGYSELGFKLRNYTARFLCQNDCTRTATAVTKELDSILSVEIRQPTRANNTQRKTNFKSFLNKIF